MKISRAGLGKRTARDGGGGAESATAGGPYAKCCIYMYIMVTLRRDILFSCR